MTDNNELKELIMLVGLPGSGKSTWLKKNLEQNEDKKYVVLSSDDIIEELCLRAGITYGEGFKQFIGPATAKLKKLEQDAFKNDRNVIYDMTNLTVKSRKVKLSKAGDNYIKIAIVFNISEDELRKRLQDRANKTGKNIPYHVIETMIKDYTQPTKAEGFDFIYTI